MAAMAKLIPKMAYVYALEDLDSKSKMKVNSKNDDIQNNKYYIKIDSHITSLFTGYYYFSS